MQFEVFSKKQISAFTWWYGQSKHAGRDAIICDGAVRSGKTVCMGISFFSWALYEFNGKSFGLCGKTIRSLRRNVVIPLTPILKELGFLVCEKLSENVLEVSYGENSNRFYLFGGQHEGSAALIQGMTLAGCLFDEVALMPRSFVEQAVARCSVSGSKFWFNCNPEFPQHWFRQEWILGAKQKNAHYLHFKMEDNPSLSEEMLCRYKSLYSGAFYRRFVEGEWVAAEGVVYSFMTEEKFCAVPKGKCSEYAISCDYGTVNPASFGLWGKKSGKWYRLKEYYFDSRKEGYQKTDEEHYKALCILAGNHAVKIVTVDPSAASFIEVIRRQGRFTVIPAKNNVQDGIRKVSSALKDGRVNICNTCLDSMREFSLYRYAEKGDRDMPLKENDHAMDDIRYFVTTIANRSDDGIVAIAAERTGQS
ncbi:MAG: PBSX family phage terminase large subunit [Bacillota bacterium]|nr:PBSX family phage terminase large subunit [Bacillota bacterium]